MKMIMAIVNRQDSGELCQALTVSGYYFTKMATTGGFLTSGNTTLLIGIEDEKVQDVLSVIRSHCSRRIEALPSSMQTAEPGLVHPMEVTVGGATVFVTDVLQFEKM